MGGAIIKAQAADCHWEVRHPAEHFINLGWKPSVPMVDELSKTFKLSQEVDCAISTLQFDPVGLKFTTDNNSDLHLSVACLRK